MKNIIERIAGGAKIARYLPKAVSTRLAVAALAALAAGGAWAAITATEVWEAAEIRGNYDSTTGLIAGHNNSAYKLNVGTGLVVGDSTGAYTLGSDGSITINSTAAHGVTIDLEGKANGGNPTSLSILVKYRSLSACNQASLISAFMTRSGTKPECGLIQTANNVLTLKPYWYIASNSSSYNFDISSPSVSASGGYALFSYDRSTIKGYTGSELNEGGTASMSWTGPTFKTAAIGGSSGEVSGFNNKWPGMVIEKIALFVGNTSDDIATYYFPSDDPTALDYDFVKTISSNTALSEITSWDTGTGTPGAEDTVHIVCENSAVLTIDTAINADTLWVEGGSVTLANGASITANMVFGSPITVAASATASISGASVYNSIACGSYSTLNISNCAINGAITDGDDFSNTHATLNITDCAINGGITAGQNNNATINTAGGVVFRSSADNYFKFSSTLNVNSGTTTYNSLNSQKLWCNINVTKGATLVNSRDDSFDYAANDNWPIHAYIRGTLTLNRKWTVAAGNYIHLYDDAVINGSASIHANISGSQTKIVSEEGTSTITAPVEKGNGSVSVQTENGTTLVLTSSTELVKSGAGTLQLKDVAWTGAVSGSEGTVEVCNTRNTAHSQVSASGITFSGKIKFTAKGTYGVYVTNKDFLSAAVIPQLELDTGTSTYNKLFFKTTFDGVTTTIRDLMGSGGFTARDSYSVAQNQTFISRQTQDTEFSGVFLSEDGAADIHKTNLIVEGDGSGNVNTLKLSGANTSNGELKVRDDAMVLFSSTGSWTNGTVTVADGGYLESQNSESIAATLAVQEGATLKFANGVPLAATEYDWRGVSSDEAVNIDLGDISPSTTPVTLIASDVTVAASKFKVTASQQGVTLSVENGALKATFANCWRNGAWSGTVSSGDNATLYISQNSTLTISEALSLGTVTVVKEGDGNVELTISGDGALTTAGWTIPEGVTVNTPASMTISGTVSGGGVINVPANTTLAMDGVTCFAKVTVEGTLRTTGTTNLSAANTSAANSLIEVVSDTTTLASKVSGIEGNITIAYGAELVAGKCWAPNDGDWYLEPIKPTGTTILDISGKLTLNTYIWYFGAGTTINLRSGASISGTGRSNTYGNLSWTGNGTLNCYANTTINAAIRTKADVSPVFNVADGVTLTIASAFVPQTSTVDNFTGSGSLTKAGAGTLRLKDIEWTKPISGSEGTVEVSTAGMTDARVNHSVSGASFSGTLKVVTPSGKAAYFDSDPEIQLTGRPELRLELGSASSQGSFYLGTPAINKYVKVRNLSGWGIVTPWLGQNGTCYYETVQEKDTAFSGTFINWSDTKLMGLTVKGGESVHSLTLGAASTTTGPLLIQDNGKVVFSGDGAWAGNVTVGVNGYLEPANASAVTNLTLQDGANIVFPASSSSLSSISALTFASGTTKIHFGSGVTPTAGTLINWSAAKLEAAPAGAFEIADSTLAGTWMLNKSKTGLSIAAAGAQIVYSDGTVAPFASTTDALYPYTEEVKIDEGATLRILDNTNIDDSTISGLAHYNIYYDNTTKTFSKAVAKVGTAAYPSLAAAVAAAADGDSVTLLRASAETITINAKAITLVQTAAFSGTLSGNGTITLQTLSTSLHFDSWTGTVVLPALTANEEYNFNAYGVSGSTVRLAGGFSTGWLANAAVNPAIEIPSGQTFTLGSFSPSYANAFAALKGDGTFAITATANQDNDLDNVATWGAGLDHYSAYFRIGDVSGFHGSIATSSDVGVALGSTKPAKNTTGGKILVYGDVTVGEGATWTALNGVILADANATLVVPSGASVPMPTTTVADSYVKATTSGSTTTYTVATQPTVSDVAFEYGADYATATVTATVSDAAPSYKLTVGGTVYTGVVSGSKVTFSNVATGRTDAYDDVSYEIAATSGSTVVPLAGDTSGSAEISDTKTWFSHDSSALTGGTWATDIDLSEPATVEDNTFTATAESTSSRVVLEFNVCFSSVSDANVDGDAQGAIKLGEENSATTFMVLAQGGGWTAVSNDALTPDPAATYKVVMTFDYANNTYAASVNDYVLTNASGSASFPLAATRTGVQTIDFAGSGTLTSMKGDQVEGYMVKDDSGSYYATIADAIAAFDAAKGPYTVLHAAGTPPSGWQLVTEAGVTVLQKLAKLMIFMVK